MTTPTRYSALPPTYRKVLKTRRLVVLYFFNQHCGACVFSGPVFLEIAKPFRPWMDIFMLDTAQSIRHPDVTGTPTVLFYKEGVLVKKLKDIGTEKSLLQDFTQHLGKIRHCAAPRKPTHDLNWLRHTLRTLCTVHRARRWNCS